MPVDGCLLMDFCSWMPVDADVEDDDDDDDDDDDFYMIVLLFSTVVLFQRFRNI